MDTAEHDPHRPRAIEHMAGASDWVRLQQQLLRPDPPHIVLVGPAGIGKSCAIRLTLGSAIAIWLRCSQDPTLRDNRDRIKAAARRRVETGQVSWIILEHADALHADSQAFLRRIIETTLGSTRFILEVRDAAAITEPLLSRTVLFNAPQLMLYEIRSEIQRRAPGLALAEAEEIARNCDGNVRWAVLQGLGSMQDNQGLGSTQDNQGLGSLKQTQGSQDKQTESGFLGTTLKEAKTWADVLAMMEAIQSTGSSPRACSNQNSTVWDRPGGICPWSLLALELSQTL